MTGSQQAGQPGRRIGYARVSTAEQTTDQQVAALRRAGCRRVFVDDAVSAIARDRPGMEKARRALRPGDVFVVWAIDRAFRSTREAILFLDDLLQIGIEFQSLTQLIDTRTPEGRKWYIDTASWAEYERAIISRRTREKMAHAKLAGKHVGRPYKLTRRKVMRAHDQVAREGIDIREVADRCEVAPITIARAFRRYGLEV
ncbi:MAG: DNA resolvase [Rhodospirillaceae bacterium]|nr:DNA resolvase [Rhodospirillaceae bacterium]